MKTLCVQAATRRFAAGLIMASGIMTGMQGSAATPAAGTVLPILRHAQDLGPAEQAGTVELTFWLKLRGEAADNVGPGQPPLTDGQIDARIAPTAVDAGTVSRVLMANGLRVTGVGPHNLYVRASGTVAQVQSALQVELHQYRLNQLTFRASARDATLPAELLPLVASVGGLSSLGAMPNVARVVQGTGALPSIVRQADAEGLRSSPVMLGANPSGLIFSAQCFNGPTSVSFSGGGASASYQGTRYGTDIGNTTPGTVAPCGYQPNDIQTAYDLTPLYKARLDGRGQTIAIVDAYGSTTVKQDLTAFSQLMGLPAPQLTVIGTPEESNYAPAPGDPTAGWAMETTLDVEWVHAIAPYASIILVVTPTNSFDDLIGGVMTAAAQPGGVAAISNSWSGYEAALYPSFQQAMDNLFKLVGAKGASLQFATGDYGDNAVTIGFYDVGWPASSPNVTAVGGVSAGLSASKRVNFQSAWGNTLTEIADTVASGSPPLDPPNNEGFSSGGGGGISDIYPAPAWQRFIGASRRQIPDISWLADPYTGAEVIYTADAQGDLGIEVVGGTSLATPMISALWGIATQKAGHRLGLAAPYLYGLPPSALTDVLPVGSPFNVTGHITDASGASAYSSGYLSAPLQGQPTFQNALYNSPFSTRWFVLGFGLDSSLQAGPGWDTATGLGVPDGWNFVMAVAGR